MSPDVSRARGYVLTLFLAYCVSTFSISLFCFHSRLCGCPRPLAPKNKHVLFGTKMIALFLGANGVLHFCKTSGTAVILVGVIQKRFTLLYARFDGSHPFFVVCLFLNDFQLVSSFYRMYPNLNWQQTSCFICRFFFLCQCQVFELQNKSDKQDRLKPSCFS
jgi:hypothetical protein